jgi:outer membrane protein assembly factor BamB
MNTVSRFRRWTEWAERCRFLVVFAGFCWLVGISGLAGDWPQFRGPDNQGVSPDKILLDWPESGPVAKWRIPLQNGFSSFAISQGKVFTLVRRTVDGQSTEVCVSLDEARGQELWATPVGKAKYTSGGDDGTSDNRGGDGPRSTPSVLGDHVYVLNAYLGLFCLHRDSGKIEWQRDLVLDYGGSVIEWQSSASPIVEDNLLFINVNSPSQPLVALQASNGAEVWRAGRSEDKTTHASPVVTTILDVRQVIFFTRYGMVSIATQTGEELWRYRFQYRTSSGASPVVCGTIVYCSSGYTTGAGAVSISKSGDIFSAKEIWRKPNELENQWSTPVHHDGYIYGLYGHGDYGSAPLKCLDVATGLELWSETGFGLGGILLVQGHLLVLSERGELVLVKASPSAYQETARFKAITGKCWNAPAISQGRIYARSTKEGICLDTAVKTLSPLQLSTRCENGVNFWLEAKTVDGSEIDPDRAHNIQVFASSSWSQDSWTRITNTWELIEGRLNLREPDSLNWSQRFYRTIENP